MCNTYSNISQGFSEYFLLGHEQRAAMGVLWSISLTEIVSQIGAWLLDMGRGIGWEPELQRVPTGVCARGEVHDCG